MMPGDIIILKEDDSPRNKWPLAIVQDAYPSDDGLVRKIRVRMADTHLDKNGVRTKSQSILERPVHKCILLLPADLYTETTLTTDGKVRPGDPHRGNHWHKLNVYCNFKYNVAVESLIVGMLFKTFGTA